jgi:transposase
MRDIKDIVRMHMVEGRSVRSIAQLSRIPYSTVHENLTAVKAKGLTWAAIEAMDNDTLAQELSSSHEQRPTPNWELIEKELKRPGVTLQLLWMEYKQEFPSGYQYSRFCELYELWAKKNDAYTPIPHKAGEEIFVDFTGDKIPYVCTETGRVLEAEIFVSVLGASGRIYVKACQSQNLQCWMEANIDAFEFNGGVTELLIPDNLRSAITTSDRYEPYANKTFEECCRHYGTFIAPARVRKPKDKSKAEIGVQMTQNQIIAALRNRTFFGLQAINEAILPLLHEVNNRPFQKLSGSRESRYLELDKPALKPLPSTRYHFREWLVKIRVGQNHHVLIEKHAYSVPYQHVHEEVEAVMDRNMVEICSKGQVIARHPRSEQVDGMTTDPAHMPPKYRHYFNSLNPEHLLAEAKAIGPYTEEWARKVLEFPGRPPKTKCFTVQGALSLGKKYGKDKLERICQRGLVLSVYSYKRLQSMCFHGADEQPLPDSGVFNSHLPQLHANVRGPKAFY